MAYEFSSELKQRIESHMASGGYDSEEELVSDAIRALDELCAKQAELRDEIRLRLVKAGQGESKPLDRDEFKAEARRRVAEEM